MFNIVPSQAGIQQSVLFHLAVFQVLPLSFVGMLEINKKVSSVYNVVVWEEWYRQLSQDFGSLNVLDAIFLISTNVLLVSGSCVEGTLIIPEEKMQMCSKCTTSWCVGFQNLEKL